jgi:hypothetical protein
MSKINPNDAKEKPELQEQITKGVAAASAAAASDKEATKISGGDRSFDELIEKSSGDLIKIKQIINQGGFSGPEKDKYTLSLHYAEWVHSRNLYMKCDYDIKGASEKYLALVNKKPKGDVEVVKAEKDMKSARDKCKNIDDELTSKAQQYIETDRRVRNNITAASQTFPTIAPSVLSTKEPFQVLRGGTGNFDVEGFAVREGFDFVDQVVSSSSNSGNTVTTGKPKLNKRLPLLSEDTSATAADFDSTGHTATKVLPWAKYYTSCSVGDSQVYCEKANRQKNEYIKTINALFERADLLLNTYYEVTKNTAARTLSLVQPDEADSILNNQKKTIALHKQNAIYDYDEYNSLSFYEDMVFYLYYVLFIMFAVVSIRQAFSPIGGKSYDIKMIIILILLGIYPKYILTVVLWVLNGATYIVELLGLKNVRFWY